MVKPYCKNCTKHNSECRCSMPSMCQVIRDVEYTQAYGCRFCLQIGSTAYLFGTVIGGRGPRLELFTPLRWFRWSKGYRETNPQNCRRVD